MMKSDDFLEEYFRILPAQKKALEKLKIFKIKDLLYHFPTRYSDAAQIEKIEKLTKGNHAVIFGRIWKLKTSRAFRKKIPMAEAVVEDDTGQIKIVWFHQAYLAKMILEGSNVRIEGKVAERKGELYFSNPKVEIASQPIDGLFAKNQKHSLYPIYPESRHLTSNWIYHKIQNIFLSGVLEKIIDPIPENILKNYNLPDLRTALIYIHTPQKEDHAQMARKRFAFEEIFFIQLERQRARHEFKKYRALIIEKKKDEIEKFVKRFPFAVTSAQKKSIEHILEDFKKGHPMSRLLEGDVGSGKTAVAATAVYAAATSKPLNELGMPANFGTLQTAYMAPTEILARQHFESFIKYFSHLPINIGLITGNGCRKFPSKLNPDGWTDISRTQLLKWVVSGEIAVLVGTHALIQKSVKFKHLALVIVDEQHRFGTAQRHSLVNRQENPVGGTPHLLSMTATPIPRTLALTLYSDLDLSLLDEMPAGRKKIITEIITPQKRAEAYEKIRIELRAGKQLYVICPRIDEPDPTKELAVQAKSVKEEAKRLKKEVFPEYEIGILHSKMHPAEKEEVMQNFQKKNIDILVATSVVEVGVNVENASLIIIEGAERFGLAQLHQLRGRVIRSNHQAYAFVFTEVQGDKARERLKALVNAKNGFELAEFDLIQRGAGELAGGKQWGISDIGMEAIKNVKMVEAARSEAMKLIENDSELLKFPLLKEHLESSPTMIHFE
ncbi:MAG: ATP-dependent DNA helicase RecG [Candidatus Zambryskibacteria bacterium CG22_combo_CG10-13_8_21_14_all_42_17]|uniref:ATP-dependent DNA helicase RecG n=1 Tax=Candidatus Zambryskibacteria bacterium CG22_combo_CG10-13_8_21_14_all_42_17 TaxID=1975118 RepID=A0A2H0BFH5_9BACT|nr:MAG: ATP-dependent DNA helicase RecG [Candidatus Zambryskibacteria bacterium CG22_combo_CG10-13_8_21_14_all_42_17]